ncbi:MAG: hypothetical protein Q9166_008173 [cf. Caloplaca sp. 2 TL-2023]
METYSCKSPAALARSQHAHKVDIMVDNLKPHLTIISHMLELYRQYMAKLVQRDHSPVDKLRNKVCHIELDLMRQYNSMLIDRTSMVFDMLKKTLFRQLRPVSYAPFHERRFRGWTKPPANDEQVMALMVFGGLDTIKQVISIPTYNMRIQALDDWLSMAGTIKDRSMNHGLSLGTIKRIKAILPDASRFFNIWKLAEAAGSDSSYRRRSTTRQDPQWQMPKKKSSSAPGINPGDAGIWATCDMHKEGLCTVELRDLFDEYASLIYGDSTASDAAIADDNLSASDDIEAEINKEVQGMQKPKHEPLFVSVKIDVHCVLFFKTRQPVEPVSFVHRICSDAVKNATVKKTRHLKRLTPMTKMGKATEKNLEEVAKAVLAPAFHQDGIPAQKFAIRTTIRNNHAMKRDDIIKRVADLVGEPHTVDLKHYDHLVLVDIYRVSIPPPTNFLTT